MSNVSRPIKLFIRCFNEFGMRLKICTTNIDLQHQLYEPDSTSESYCYVLCTNRIKKLFFIHLHRMLLDRTNTLTVNVCQTEHGDKIIIRDFDENTFELIEKKSKLQINKLTELLFNENTFCCIKVKMEKHPESVLGLTVNALMYNNCIYQNKKIFSSSDNEHKNECGKFVMEYISNKLKQRNRIPLCRRHIIDETKCNAKRIELIDKTHINLNNVINHINIFVIYCSFVLKIISNNRTNELL